jgi:hypothetical protein
VSAREVLGVERRLDETPGAQQMLAEDSGQQPRVEPRRQPLAAELQDDVRTRPLGELAALVDQQDLVDSRPCRGHRCVVPLPVSRLVKSKDIH